MNKLIISTIVTFLTLSSQAETIGLGFDYSGLEPMKGQHYEGWNIIDGKPQSTGRFSIVRNGVVYSVNSMGTPQAPIGKNGHALFDVDTSHLKATTFVLTIEPNGDMDQGPSDVHLMGGDYDENEAALSIAHPSSLGDSFMYSQGTFILAAPTGGTPNQGVWFVNPGKGNGSLQLPPLPEGWAYEGWIINKKNDGKLSTGLFKEVSQRDSDGAGKFAGPFKLRFPQAPGQDFVTTNILLDDGIHSIVLTVEPYPDYDPAPYSIKILKADITKGAPGMQSFELDNIANTSTPTGKITVH